MGFNGEALVPVLGQQLTHHWVGLWVCIFVALPFVLRVTSTSPRLSLGLLRVPFTRTSTMQSRAFSVVGPLVLNCLPLALRSLPRVAFSPRNSFSNLKQHYLAAVGLGELLSSPTYLKRRYINVC